MVLYYLKDSGTVNMTANSFGVSICTVTCSIREVCQAIKEHLCNKYIHLPKDQSSLEKLIAGWEQKTGFPMVLGAIDDTHIPIMQPIINSQDYEIYNYIFFLKQEFVFLGES